MRRVTKENLIVQIERLYKIKDEQGQLSMNGEYTLQAYKMLLAMMEVEPVAVPEALIPYPSNDKEQVAYNTGWNACRAVMLNQK